MKIVLMATVVWMALAGSSVSAQTNIYLLGEVHDNPNAHAERFRFIENLVAKKFRPVIAMEQFDRENQATLNDAMLSCKNADCVIQQAGGKGWEWNFYKPVIETAIKLRLPIIAANISPKDTMKIVRDGLGAALSADTLRDFKLDKPLENEVFQKQKIAIDEGHCRTLPKSAFAGMVNAQVARDVWMAKMIRDNSGRGLILLAGNGHVRKDVGVYHWLNNEERARTQVIAYVEGKDDGSTAQGTQLYDSTFHVEPIDRGDPCEAFTGRAKIQT
jgi:hypothetical protein